MVGFRKVVVRQQCPTHNKVETQSIRKSTAFFLINSFKMFKWLLPSTMCRDMKVKDISINCLWEKQLLKILILEQGPIICIRESHSGCNAITSSIDIDPHSVHYVLTPDHNGRSEGKCDRPSGVSWLRTWSENATNHVEVKKCCIDLPWAWCPMVFLGRDEIHGHKYSEELSLEKSPQWH